MPPDTVYVGRPTRWGNPFPVDVYGQVAAVDKFRRWLDGTMSADERAGASRADRWSDPDRYVTLTAVRDWLLRDPDGIPALRGKSLACWCGPDQPCHADVLIEIANRPTP